MGEAEQSAEHILQDCQNHQRLKEDCWTEAITVQSKVYRTRDDRLREDRWTETTTLQSKVYRTRDDRLREDRWTETTTV